VPFLTARFERVMATSSDGAVVIGEVAHIHAYEDDGPRANPKLSLLQRNSYPNLLLLCPNHHSLIDKQPDTYPAEMLREWKREIENRITTAIRNMMPSVDFSELRQITNFLLNHAGKQDSDLSVIPPAEKIKKNNLSSTAHAYLAIALAKADVVRSFIDAFTKLDDSFASRLRAGFISEYERLN